MTTLSDEEQDTKVVPRWLVAAGLGVASYVVYKALIQTSYFPTRFIFSPHESEEYTADYPKGEKYWVTNPWECVKIRRSRVGNASLEPVRIFEVFERAVAFAPKSVWLLKEYKNAETDEYEWHSWTREQVYGITLDVARAFIAMGLEPWQSVSIIGFNAPEWHFADLGAIYAGGLVAGIYATNNAGQCQYVASHSKTAIVVCENEKQLNKFLEIGENIPTLKCIIVWDQAMPSNDPLITEGCDKYPHLKILHWREFIKYGRDKSTKEELDNEMRSRIDQIKPGHCCTLIYTSGTTGIPKAVMLSHDNITFDARMFWSTAKHFDAGPHATISYLPMSHIAAQLADLHYPLAKMAGECSDFKTYFARPDALKGSLKITIKAARPTFFFGVPRVWEKFYEAIKAKSAASEPSAVKLMLINYLKSVGLQGYRNREIHGSQEIPTGYWLAQKMLFPKLLNALGFDRCQGFYTGAAPVQKQTLNFFASVGIDLLEVYGMSESCGMHTIGIPFHMRMGTVGPTSNGTQTLIQHNPDRDKPGNGEICMRGRHIMMGYMYDEEKTRRTIDDEGWLHSGDVGSIDEFHLLSITGRIKELLITAGGENIAPLPIEDYIKAECPALSNVVLIGDQKKYLTCLITLRCIPSEDDLTFTNELSEMAVVVDGNCRVVADTRESQVWTEYIQRAIDKYNTDPDACASRAQRVQYFRILDGDFGVDSGELTSTLKLKRSVVYEKFADYIEDMYTR